MAATGGGKVRVAVLVVGRVTVPLTRAALVLVAEALGGGDAAVGVFAITGSGEEMLPLTTGLELVVAVFVEAQAVSAKMAMRSID